MAAKTMRVMGAIDRLPALRSFWGGLTAATLSSALGAIAFAILELVLAIALITPRNVARIDPRYLKDHRSDDRATTTVEALKLHFSSSHHRSVVMLGASNARKGLVDAGRNLERELRAATGERIDVHTLFADRQTIHEWVILLDQLPPSFEGVLVFTVFDVLSRAESGVPDRLALTSPTLAHPSDAFRGVLEQSEPAPRFGLYFLDHLGFFAARRGVLARLGPAPPRRKARWKPLRHGDHNGKIRAAWQRATRRLAWREEPLLFEYLPALEEIARLMKRPGVEVVFVESPVNPRFDTMKPEAQARSVYESAMLKFAERTGAHYWNPSVEARLRASEFRDWVHLENLGAEARYEAALVERLGAVLRGEVVPDGPRSPPPDPEMLDDQPTEPGAADDDGEDLDDDL